MSETPQMLEYELVLQSVSDGALTLDLHTPGSSGSSHVAEFSSHEELREFLTRSGLSPEKVDEIETMWHGMQKGDAFYAKTFLPRSVEDGFKDLVQQARAA